MKKNIYILAGLLFLLLLIFTVINIFDQDLDPKAFTLADLPTPSFEKDNGFFYIWGLTEAPDVDVLSESYRKNLENLFDPKKRTQEYQKAFDGSAYKNKFKKYLDVIKKIDFPDDNTRIWITKLTPQLEKIKKAEEICKPILNRYKKATKVSKVIDFVYPDFQSPIPNLLAWLKIVKLNSAIHLTNLDNNWDYTVTDILKHMEFLKHASASSRILITGLIAKANIKILLRTLAEIMNHPDCPDRIYQKILVGLKPLTYEEYGNRNNFITECLSAFQAVDYSRSEVSWGSDDYPGFLRFLPIGIFLQKNRTKNYFNDYYALLINYDITPPYKWKENPVKKEKIYLKSKSAMWWIRNPIGKVLYNIMIPNLSRAIHNSLEIKAKYDMTLILAELHLEYISGVKVENILKNLKSYQQIDLCSGKPYKWNQEKMVLYGIGTDLKDNDGIENLTNHLETDFSVPVVFKKKDINVDKKKE